MALLLGIGTALVDEYLAVFRQYDLPQYAERLAANVERICGSARSWASEGIAATVPAAEKGALV